jgi:hypothetical protein
MPDILGASLDCPMADLCQDQILMAIPSVNGGKLLARMLPTLRFKPSTVPGGLLRVCT